MAKLSFTQWIKLGFGAMSVSDKHSETIKGLIIYLDENEDELNALFRDSIDLLRSIIPPDPEAESTTVRQPIEVAGGITPADAINKIQTGNLTKWELEELERQKRDAKERPWAYEDPSQNGGA